MKNSKRSRKLFLKKKRAKGELWIAWSYKEYKGKRLTLCKTIFNKILTDQGRSVTMSSKDFFNERI